MARNSKVILAQGIKLDKTYKSVLCYTESQMLSLVQSNAITTLTECSYIRDDNSLELGVSYANCLKSNYLAFQNPDYSNKWFFAFIDKVEYISNAVSRIRFTVDIWSTWYDYWTTRACYILRQHDNVDYPGRNTVPENLEHGEYVLNNQVKSTYFRNYNYMIVASVSTGGHDPLTTFGDLVINGACYLATDLDGIQSTINTIKAITTPQQGEILEVYMVPSDLCVGVTGHVLEITGSWPVKVLYETIFASKPTTLGGNYSPVNKKLLTYPYCYILANNQIGNSNIWRLEDFSSTSITVTYTGVPSVGCSIIASPDNYKQGLSLEEALIGAKYPTLGWREDSYTNWLTQNAVNNKAQAMSSGGSIVLGTIGLAAGLFTANPMLITGGAGLIASGTMGALEAGAEYYQHSLEPDTFKGLISAGDVLTSTGDLSFNYNYMTIKTEYAQKLDKFFTRFGYAQNEIQMPLFEINSYREKYNFIQIAKDQVTAIPKIVNNININADALESINNMFRAGITIWKNYDINFGNYATTNPIITPTPTPTPTP